jgi:hypothetical protein
VAGAHLAERGNRVNAHAAQPTWIGQLDRLTLMAAAAESTGLEAFGDPRFEEPLDHYLEAIGSEADLTEAGQAGFSMDVVRLLTNRLLHQAERSAHPEIASEVVDDPIVIAGLPRTGTTKLQRMLALHPRIRGLQMWQSFSPARLPGSEGADPDPRIAICEQMLGAVLEQAPGFLAAHPMAAEEVDEETFTMQGSFDFRGNGLFYRVPGYVRWLDTRSSAHCYEHLREWLRYLQWQNGGRHQRSSVLKSPVHLGQLDAVLDAFPRATVVHCHRDPTDAVPSLCRLIEHIRYSRGARTVDLEELGDHMLAFCRQEWERNLAQRDAVPAEAVVDLSYAEIASDGSGVVTRLLERRGVKVEDDVLQALQAWESRSDPHRYGPHEYSLERYGLARAQVLEAFADYLERFSDPCRVGV